MTASPYRHGGRQKKSAVDQDDYNGSNTNSTLMQGHNLLSNSHSNNNSMNNQTSNTTTGRKSVPVIPSTPVRRSLRLAQQHLSSSEHSDQPQLNPFDNLGKNAQNNLLNPMESLRNKFNYYESNVYHGPATAIRKSIIKKDLNTESFPPPPHLHGNFQKNNKNQLDMHSRNYGDYGDMDEDEDEDLSENGDDIQDNERKKGNESGENTREKRHKTVSPNKKTYISRERENSRGLKTESSIGSRLSRWLSGWIYSGSSDSQNLKADKIYNRYVDNELTDAHRNKGKSFMLSPSQDDVTISSSSSNLMEVNRRHQTSNELVRPEDFIEHESLPPILDEMDTSINHLHNRPSPRKAALSSDISRYSNEETRINTNSASSRILVPSIDPSSKIKFNYPHADFGHHSDPSSPRSHLSTSKRVTRRGSVSETENFQFGNIPVSNKMESSKSKQPVESEKSSFIVRKNTPLYRKLLRAVFRSISCLISCFLFIFWKPFSGTASKIIFLPRYFVGFVLSCMFTLIKPIVTILFAPFLLISRFIRRNLNKKFWLGVSLTLLLILYGRLVWKLTPWDKIKNSLDLTSYWSSSHISRQESIKLMNDPLLNVEINQETTFENNLNDLHTSILNHLPEGPFRQHMENIQKRLSILSDSLKSISVDSNLTKEITEYQNVKLKEISAQLEHLHEQAELFWSPTDKDSKEFMELWNEIDKLKVLLSNKFSSTEKENELTDFALGSLGSVVLDSLSSTPLRYLHDPISRLLDIGILSKPSKTVLHSDNSPGNCWCFDGSVGQLTIQLFKSINPTHIQVEHFSSHGKSPIIGLDKTSAIKDFQIWGFAGASKRDIENGKLLGQFTYTNVMNPSSHSLNQIFPLSIEEEELYKVLQLRILSNWGNDDYTCLYQVKVHSTVEDATIEKRNREIWYRHQYKTALKADQLSEWQDIDGSHAISSDDFVVTHDTPIEGD